MEQDIVDVLKNKKCGVYHSLTNALHTGPDIHAQRAAKEILMLRERCELLSSKILVLEAMLRGGEYVFH